MGLGLLMHLGLGLGKPILKLDEQDMSGVVAMWHSPNGEDLLRVVVMCHSVSGENSLM